VSQDLELVKQLDTVKLDGLKDKKELDLLKRENAELKLDLGRVSKELLKVAGPEKKDAGGRSADFGQQIQSHG